MESLPDSVLCLIMETMASSGPSGIKSLVRFCAAWPRVYELEQDMEYKKLKLDNASDAGQLPSMSWIAPRAGVEGRIRDLKLPRDFSGEQFAYMWEDDVDEEHLVGMLECGQLLMLHIPDRLLTRELCLECVRLNGNHLRFVPDSILTAEFELEAAHLDPWAFGYLTKREKTEELLLSLINTADVDPAMLGESWAVPWRLLTPAVLAAAKAQSGEREVLKWTKDRHIGDDYI